MTFRILSDDQRSLLYKAAGAIEIFLIGTILIAYGTGIAALLTKESQRPAHDYSLSQVILPGQLNKYPFRRSPERRVRPPIWE